MKKSILVTGATGYIGGRLVPRLLEAGYPVRCMVRDESRLRGHSWTNKVDVTEGDALEPQQLLSAMREVSTAYYLIHGMQGGSVKPERDIQAASNFAAMAKRAGVDRIIYLGELADQKGKLSPYLRSRHEVGGILRNGKVPVTEFQSGMTIGSGSVLFEMVRYTAEIQPVFICPKWWFSLAQPIAIGNVLDYLILALECPESKGKTIQIGGTSKMSYAQMLLDYAHERGLQRLLIPFPFNIPNLSAYWVHMVTPVHWRVVLPLIEGLQVESLVQNDLAKDLFPQIKLLGYRDALHLALGQVASDKVETSWSDSLVVSAGDFKPVALTITEGMLLERRQMVVDLEPSIVHKSYMGLGGERGWLYMDWTWRVRGWMDKVVGGVGLRRGRRNPDEIRVGESLDFWRVEAVEKDHLLRLRAEMKVPGKAWLEFQAIPKGKNNTLLQQTAFFAPHGLAGFLYWYLLYPIHGFIFSGMIRKIAQRAFELASPGTLEK